MTTEELERIVTEISERHWSWFKFFRRWRATFWICGVLAATSSALAASDKVAGIAAPYFAVLSTICIAILGFMNPQRRANAYVTAWRTVSIALLHYKAGSCTVFELISAVDRAEAHIGEIDTKDANQPLTSVGQNKTVKTHGQFDHHGQSPTSEQSAEKPL